MAAPTYAQGWTQLRARVKQLNEIEKFGRSNATNYVALRDTLIAAAIYDYGSAVMAAADAELGVLASLLSPERIQSGIAAAMADLTAAISVTGTTGAPEVSPPSLLFDRIRDYMIANADTVQSRRMVYGAIAVGGSNVGTGTISRLTVDEDGFDLEASTAELKRFTCKLDQGQLDKHKEFFRCDGAKPEPTLLKLVGSGTKTGISCLTTQDSQGYIVNPSFSQLSGTQPTVGTPIAPATTTSITGWTLDSVTDVTVTKDTVYRDLIGETNKYAVTFAGNRSITQTIEDQKKARFTTPSPRTPMFVQVAVYRASSCDGTLTLTLGNTTRAVTMSTLTNSAWNVVTLTLNKNLYYKNFKKNTMTVAAALTGRTVGSLTLDDWIISPMQLIDGVYYAAVGSATPFMREDTFTFTDTENATRGIFQYWGAYRSRLAVLNDGFCWPSHATTPTIADP